MFFAAISPTLLLTLAWGCRYLAIQIKALVLALCCVYAQVKLFVSAGEGHARAATAESRHLQISLLIVNKSEVLRGLASRDHIYDAARVLRPEEDGLAIYLGAFCGIAEIVFRGDFSGLAAHTCLGLQIPSHQIKALVLAFCHFYAQVKFLVSSGEGHARAAAAKSRHLQVSLLITD